MTRFIVEAEPGEGWVGLELAPGPELPRQRVMLFFGWVWFGERRFEIPAGATVVGSYRSSSRTGEKVLPEPKGPERFDEPGYYILSSGEARDARTNREMVIRPYRSFWDRLLRRNRVGPLGEGDSL